MNFKYFSKEYWIYDFQMALFNFIFLNHCFVSDQLEWSYFSPQFTFFLETLNFLIFIVVELLIKQNDNSCSFARSLDLIQVVWTSSFSNYSNLFDPILFHISPTLLSFYLLPAVPFLPFIFPAPVFLVSSTQPCLSSTHQASSILSILGSSI